MFGYTVADKSDSALFYHAMDWIEQNLGYRRSGEAAEDIYGNIRQDFIVPSGEKMWLELDCDVDYVAIVSSFELPIRCLHQWTSESSRQ